MKRLEYKCRDKACLVLTKMKNNILLNFVSMKEKMQILAMNIAFTTKEELAYKADFFGQFIGTFFYAFLSIVFVDILYSNVDTIASYSRDEMLLYFFMTQTSLMLTGAASVENIIDMIYSVHNGALDTVLTKPMPALFFLSWKRIRLLVFLANTIGSIIPIFIILDLHALPMSLKSVVCGIVIHLLGFYCTHVFQFIAGLSSFWFGYSEEMLNLTWSFEYNIGRVIPFEGFSKEAQVFFSTLVPVLVSVGISTSVMLQKSNAYIMIVFVCLTTILLGLLKNTLWTLALRHYSSASS